MGLKNNSLKELNENIKNYGLIIRQFLKPFYIQFELTRFNKDESEEITVIKLHKVRKLLGGKKNLPSEVKLFESILADYKQHKDEDDKRSYSYIVSNVYRKIKNHRKYDTHQKFYDRFIDYKNKKKGEKK